MENRTTVIIVYGDNGKTYISRKLEKAMPNSVYVLLETEALTVSRIAIDVSKYDCEHLIYDCGVNPTPETIEFADYVIEAKYKAEE